MWPKFRNFRLKAYSPNGFPGDLKGSYSPLKNYLNEGFMRVGMGKLFTLTAVNLISVS